MILNKYNKNKWVKLILLFNQNKNNDWLNDFNIFNIWSLLFILILKIINSQVLNVFNLILLIVFLNKII